MDGLQPETVCKHKHFLRRNVLYDEVSPETGQSTDAVSYTHLDVYKRQAQYILAGAGLAGPDRAGTAGGDRT